MEDRRRPIDKIACPRCGCLQSKVVRCKPTKEQQRSGGYWRRRECGACGRKFDTEEKITAA